MKNREYNLAVGNHQLHQYYLIVLRVCGLKAAARYCHSNLVDGFSCTGGVAGDEAVQQKFVDRCQCLPRHWAAGVYRADYLHERLQILDRVHLLQIREMLQIVVQALELAQKWALGLLGNLALETRSRCPAPAKTKMSEAAARSAVGENRLTC